MISGDTSDNSNASNQPDTASSKSSATSTNDNKKSMVIPPSDITIKTSSNADPKVQNNIARGNRPTANSPIVTITKENPNASSYNKRQKAAAANGVVESYVPAGIAIHLMFPGLSASTLQDVYVKEPPAGKSAVISQDIVIPLNYKVGSGITAQTVGPVHVHVHASANEA